MTIEERVKLYKELFPECKAVAPLAQIISKGFRNKTGIVERMELIRELDTLLAEAYKVWLPVVTFFVRDNNYVFQTKEIFLGDLDLEAFLHQFRHHLQNEAREQSRKLLLVEDDAEIDYRIPYKDTELIMAGEDDSRAWAKMLIESV